MRYTSKPCLVDLVADAFQFRFGGSLKRPAIITELPTARADIVNWFQVVLGDAFM